MGSRIRRRMGAASIGFASALLLVVGVAPPVSAATPSNDDPEDATVISSIPFETELDSTDATAETDSRGCTVDHSVWYRFRPTETRRLVASTAGSEFSSLIAVYEGDLDAASRIACVRERHSFEAEAGTEYWFKVGGRPGVLRFSLVLGVPPPNDDMSNAKRVGKLPFSHQADTHEATLDLEDPSCFGKARSVWYRFNARKSRKIGLRTKATYDATISVYERSGGSLRQVVCTGNNRVRFPSKRGRTYLIMVGSHSNSPGGLLEFRAKALPKPPPPLKIRLHVDRAGRVSTVTGTARVTGVVHCNFSTKVTVSGRLRQKVHSRIVEDSESRSVKCVKNKPARWSFKFEDRRAFKAGAAGMSATARSGKRKRSLDRIVSLRACDRCL